MEYMICTSCHACVQVNNTGICLGCQQGFNSDIIEDHYQFHKLDEIERLKEREKELEDAIKEGEKQESNIKKHTNRNGSGKTSKASNSHRIQCSRKSKEEKKKIDGN